MAVGDVTKNFVNDWNRLHREVVESPFLEVFKNCGDVALREVVGVGWGWS